MIESPLCSKREMIAPIRRRWTQSGFSKTKVRSIQLSPMTMFVRCKFYVIRKLAPPIFPWIVPITQVSGNPRILKFQARRLAKVNEAR